MSDRDANGQKITVPSRRKRKRPDDNKRKPGKRKTVAKNNTNPQANVDVTNVSTAAAKIVNSVAELPPQERERMLKELLISQQQLPTTSPTAQTLPPSNQVQEQEIDTAQDEGDNDSDNDILDVTSDCEGISRHDHDDETKDTVEVNDDDAEVGNKDSAFMQNCLDSDEDLDISVSSPKRTNMVSSVRNSSNLRTNQPEQPNSQVHGTTSATIHHNRVNTTGNRYHTITVPNNRANQSAREAAAVTTPPITNSPTLNNSHMRPVNTFRSSTASGTGGPCDSLDGDYSTVITAMETMKKCIMTEIDDKLDGIKEELKKDRDFSMKIRDDVAELSTIATSTATFLMSKDTPSNSRQQELERKLCILPAVFSDVLMMNVMTKCLVGLCLMNLNVSNYGAHERNGTRLLKVMFFCVQPRDKKNKFESETGKLFSQFRNGLLLTAFKALQDNVFKTFREDKYADSLSLKTRQQIMVQCLQPSHNADSNSFGEHAQAWYPIAQPSWLRPGFVTQSHCETAARKLEVAGGKDNVESSQCSFDNESSDMSIDQTEKQNVTSKSKTVKHGPLADTDIALTAAEKAYKIVTKTLRKCREAAKKRLFYDIMYLFSSWKQSKLDIDQSKMKLEWEKPSSRFTQPLDDAPLMTKVRVTDRFRDQDHSVNNANLQNLMALGNHMTNTAELSLVVTHDVLVDGITRTIRYRIHLIEVAANMLASYSSCDAICKSQYILSVDENCMKGIVRLALSLRRLISECIDDMHNDATGVPWAALPTSETRNRRKRNSNACQSDTSLNGPTENNGSYNFKSFDDLNIPFLLPVPSRIKDYLRNSLLSMTTEEYDARHEAEFRSSSNLGSSSIDPRPSSSAITENAQLGVYTFD